MASYLLLRDNKQKGPYSTQELISLGLKAYDLVWLEGRSAAWRYPSEVEELKPYAPIVEEQPFDRFFKKAETEENDITHSQKKVEQNASITIAPVETITSREKKIYVSLPGSRPGKIQIEQKPAAREIETVKLSQEQNQEPEQKPVLLEKKFSQPLDEIKEMYVQSLVDRKRKSTRSKSLVSTLKKVSVTFYVLVLGILIGFTVKNISFGKGILANSTTSPEVKKQDSQAEPSKSNTGQTQGTSIQNNTGAVKNAEPVNSEFSFTGDTQDETVNNAEVKDNTVFGQQKNLEKKGSEQNQNTASKDPEDETPLLNEDTPEDVTTRPINGERQKVVRTATDKNVAGNNKNSSSVSTEENIRKLVTVKGNDYKRGTFGGIFDLQLTVKNDTRYILDEVVVELHYLKPSEQPLKKETIHFNSISPYGTSTINIPPSPRGIKVSYHITNIKYKVGNNDTADL